MKALRSARLLELASRSAWVALAAAAVSSRFIPVLTAPAARWAFVASWRSRLCSVSALTMAETAASTHSITVLSSVESSLYAAASASTSRNMP